MPGETSDERREMFALEIKGQGRVGRIGFLTLEWLIRPGDSLGGWICVFAWIIEKPTVTRAFTGSQVDKTQTHLALPRSLSLIRHACTNRNG